MGMRGLTLLSRIEVSMTVNKWLRKVFKQDSLAIQALWSQGFLGGVLVIARDVFKRLNAVAEN